MHIYLWADCNVHILQISIHQHVEHTLAHTCANQIIKDTTGFHVTNHFMVLCWLIVDAE